MCKDHFDTLFRDEKANQKQTLLTKKTMNISKIIHGQV